MADQPRDLSKIPGFDERPSIDPDSSVALDDLLKKAETPEDEKPPDEKPPDEKPPDEKPPDEKPPDEKPPDEKPPDEKPPDEKPPDEKPPDEKPPDEKPPDEKPPDEKPAADDFEGVVLPPYSKPKSVEAFDKVKEIAREKIAAVAKERDEFKKQAEEAAAKNTGGIPAEVEAELKELREFRAKMDVEADKEFGTVNVQVEENIKSIYDRLKAGGFSDEHIEQIKKLGGPSEVDWESVAAKMPASLRRFVEAKLVENETLLDKKTRAVEKAKENATEYLRTKREAETGAREASVKQAETRIKELVPQLGWLEERRPKEGATDADKKAVEAHNGMVKEVNAFLTDAAKDDSPQFRGILAVGYAQLLKLRADYAVLKSSGEARVKELEAKLKDTTDLLERVKKSSTTRFRESSAEGAETVKKADDFTTSGADALDNLAKAHLTGAK